MMEVAAHRGNVEGFPENTMPAFESAYALGVDMIELDLRMTSDGEIVVIHDSTVDRTSNGHGIVSNMTLEELKTLDFGIRKSEDFRGTRIPTFREFLELTRRDSKMQFNFEFKDYIAEKGEKFALESARKTIALIEKYGLADRMYINSFDGNLLMWIDKTYGHKYRLHGYYPYKIMGNTDAVNVLYCICMFNVSYSDSGKIVWSAEPICEKSQYDEVIALGIHPWVGAGAVTEEQILHGYENGGELITTNHPAEVMKILAKHGLRKPSEEN
jgi:glycerophosphoryl diester phosphodiesterase